MKHGKQHKHRVFRKRSNAQFVRDPETRERKYVGPMVTLFDPPPGVKGRLRSKRAVQVIRDPETGAIMSLTKYQLRHPQKKRSGSVKRVGEEAA